MLNYLGKWVGDRVRPAFDNILKNNVNKIGKYVSEVFSITKAEGSVGVLGIARDTAANIWNTINWGGPRSFFNPASDPWSPFHENGKLNPFDKVRRVYSGAVETITNFTGGAIGLIHSRTGNAVRDISSNIAYGVGSLVLGDMERYREFADNEKTKTPYEDII